VILPESSTGNADQLYHRLRGAVSSRPVGQAGRLSLSAGIAELVSDDDPTRFFERADEALYRAKELGKGQVVEAGKPGLTAAPEATQQPGTASSQ
jgi:diguanylate cyclase